jgi:hypothetical protein
LTIECSWRLRDNEIILVGCGEYDSERAYREALEKLSNLLLGQTIKNIKFIRPVSDLIISFENELVLELFSDSINYENWSLSNGKGFEAISGRGGDCILLGK